ncbi:hypothetical protein HYH03_011325 [Edaphochlamys debaryana]|uniref:Uncharacterized protein n=1 Tax=Edaphochlamys debaryana TaxID=47281 RepID=A0A836BWJ1_9CHLO|nr:hypothetical protein HYH03_011325 [Edaphochlamys debaryana]|eukprot:KAG2490198.1 hypothetical protein HYH03_011325 [Edaphochlamys debaryana]
MATRPKASQPEDDWTVRERFTCERVCVSKKLVDAVGGAAKEATPGACVTVCGVSAVDACTEACQRAVCVQQSHVPAWNESCEKRCVSECLRTRQGTQES